MTVAAGVGVAASVQASPATAGGLRAGGGCRVGQCRLQAEKGARGARTVGGAEKHLAWETLPTRYNPAMFFFNSPEHRPQLREVLLRTLR